ncbi:MAG: hypothetical protein LBD40_01045 [Puniceicoccales bacterium]|jgi:hypothetical protein|nr:hypothetical protein [Puniceicoccales bacterium]
MPDENVELGFLRYRLVAVCTLAAGTLAFVALLASHTRWTFGPFLKPIRLESLLTLILQDTYPDDRIDLEDTAALYIQTSWNYFPSFPECDLPEDALLLFPPDFESTSVRFCSPKE